MLITNSFIVNYNISKEGVQSVLVIVLILSSLEFVRERVLSDVAGPRHRSAPHTAYLLLLLLKLSVKVVVYIGIRVILWLLAERWR